MDRKARITARRSSAWVALRKESVDRKSLASTQAKLFGVALRKESVDRNNLVINLVQGIGKSLSARRAWIEIGRAGGAADIDHRRSPQGERG